MIIKSSYPVQKLTEKTEDMVFAKDSQSSSVENRGPAKNGGAFTTKVNGVGMRYTKIALIVALRT